MAQDPTYQISKNCATAFILGLRTVFADNAKYTYSDDMEQTKIEITDLHPIEVSFFPAIIVSSITGPNSSIYFDDDFLYEIRDDSNVLIGEKHGNQLHMSTTLSTWSLSTIARQEITDLAYFYLKTATSDFADAGIELRNINYSSPSTETIGTRIFHKQSLIVDTYSEWTNTVDISTGDLITGFNITVTQDVVTFS